MERRCLGGGTGSRGRDGHRRGRGGGGGVIRGAVPDLGRARGRPRRRRPGRNCGSSGSTKRGRGRATGIDSKRHLAKRTGPDRPALAGSDRARDVRRQSRPVQSAGAGHHARRPAGVARPVKRPVAVIGALGERPVPGGALGAEAGGRHVDPERARVQFRTVSGRLSGGGDCRIRRPISTRTSRRRSWKRYLSPPPGPRSFTPPTPGSRRSTRCSTTTGTSSGPRRTFRGDPAGQSGQGGGRSTESWPAWLVLVPGNREETLSPEQRSRQDELEKRLAEYAEPQGRPGRKPLS